MRSSYKQRGVDSSVATATPTPVLSSVFQTSTAQLEQQENNDDEVDRERTSKPPPPPWSDPDGDPDDKVTSRSAPRRAASQARQMLSGPINPADLASAFDAIDNDAGIVDYSAQPNDDALLPVSGSARKRDVSRSPERRSNEADRSARQKQQEQPRIDPKSLPAAARALASDDYVPPPRSSLPKPPPPIPIEDQIEFNDGDDANRAPEQPSVYRPLVVQKPLVSAIKQTQKPTSERRVAFAARPEIPRVDQPAESPGHQTQQLAEIRTLLISALSLVDRLTQSHEK